MIQAEQMVVEQLKALEARVAELEALLDDDVSFDYDELVALEVNEAAALRQAMEAYIMLEAQADELITARSWDRRGHCVMPLEQAIQLANIRREMTQLEKLFDPYCERDCYLLVDVFDGAQVVVTPAWGLNLFGWYNV